MNQLGSHEIIFEEMDAASELVLQSNFDGSLDTMKDAQSQRKRNKMMANTIHNQSAMNSQTFWCWNVFAECFVDYMYEGLKIMRLWIIKMRERDRNGLADVLR